MPIRSGAMQRPNVVRYHIAPEVRRGGITVQQHDGVALSHVHVRHLAAEDPSPFLLVRKCRRDHVGCPFSQSASSPLLILALDAHDPQNHATSEIHIFLKSGKAMSALGQKQTSAHVRVMSALPPKADIGERGGMSALCQKRTSLI